MNDETRLHRRLTFNLCLILMWSISTQLYPVSGAALLPLLISNSPRANGMGNTYTASFADDPLAVHFNPAFVGRMADQYLFSGTLYPVKTPWLRTFVDNMYITSQTYQIGYNFRKTYPTIPISIGVGYSQAYFDYGIQEGRDVYDNSISTFRSWDRSTEYSIGLCLDYFIKASVGITFKDIDSNLESWLGGIASAKTRD